MVSRVKFLPHKDLKIPHIGCAFLHPGTLVGSWELLVEPDEMLREDGLACNEAASHPEVVVIILLVTPYYRN